MGKYSPIFTCAVCGVRLPDMTRQELRNAGCSTLRGDGSEVHHCPRPRHSDADILKMLNASPTFCRASQYRKYVGD